MCWDAGSGQSLRRCPMNVTTSWFEHLQIGKFDTNDRWMEQRGPLALIIFSPSATSVAAKRLTLAWGGRLAWEIGMREKPRPGLLLMRTLWKGKLGGQWQGEDHVAVPVQDEGNPFGYSKMPSWPTRPWPCWSPSRPSRNDISFLPRGSVVSSMLVASTYIAATMASQSRW